MYLTEKLKIFVGKLLCAEDHSELRLGNESSIMSQKKDPCEKSVRRICSLVASGNTSEPT